MSEWVFKLAMTKPGYFGVLHPSDFSYLFWSLGQNGLMGLSQPQPRHSALDLAAVGAETVNLQQ